MVDYWHMWLPHIKKELQSIPFADRSTFNPLMINSGWASFPIYPSLPKYNDLILLQQNGKETFENKRGAWKNDKTLIGYEFRMCVRLYETTRKIINKKSVKTNSWITRYCLDMTREIFQPQDYHKIEPYNRIFIWAKDVSSAVGKMNLLPA